MTAAAILLAVFIVALGSFIGCTCAMAFVARMKRAQAKRSARAAAAGMTSFAGVAR